MSLVKDFPASAHTDVDLPLKPIPVGFQYKRPPELDGPGREHPVVVVGAGPVGLTMALSIARQGVPCVLLKDNTQVCSGSRALGMSRRTLEIWDALHAVKPIAAHGKGWNSGRSFYKEQTILEFRMPDEPELQYRAMFNLQQSHTETYLVAAVMDEPLIDFRPANEFLRVKENGAQVVIEVQCPDGIYELKSRYLIACDGARSGVRSSMGLKLEGTSYEAAYLIADISLKTDALMERRCWFDPPSNPGFTVLMHGQPDGIWRLDYQLAPGEDAESAALPDNVIPRIKRHFEFIGETGEWELQWSSVYRVHSRALDDFRHGGIFFAGDAAHLMPIFGIRGLNSGVEDAWNLGWKIAHVYKGLADSSLLQTYSAERHLVFQENAALASRNAWFMTPPNDGVQQMRDAVLSLALSTDQMQDILNPKQASYVPLRQSPLSTPDTEEFQSGPRPGEVAPDIRIHCTPADRHDNHLQSLFDGRFGFIYFGGNLPLQAEVETALRTLESESRLNLVVVGNESSSSSGCVNDADLSIHARFGATQGTTYLIRPDHNVAARWKTLVPGNVKAALGKCLQIEKKALDIEPLTVPLSHAESAYRSIGDHLGKLDASHGKLFLAKLAMLLAVETTPEALTDALRIAKAHLDKA